MNQFQFDGRVAIVTGAGRGIGRAHAELLAARGANVVVNDLGGSIQGDGSDPGPADEVAAAIGGLADHSDVGTVEGAEALVQRAVDAFGRVDIVVNNAGIMRWAAMPDADAETLARHLAVHVGGSFNTTRAAWPHMVEQQYGRIVMTGSTGMFGLPGNVSYATAKAGVIGLARTLAVEGARHGITANVVAPVAFTRMAGPKNELSDAMAPELVAPLVAYLAHEDCPVNGEIYVAGAGRYARLFLATTPGSVVNDSSVEAVAAHWAEINDEGDYSVPADLLSWSAAFTEHLRSL